MPNLDVAPIYSDAWALTDYEGMAVIVEEDLHSVETTLLGITCRLYWVRFFYTEINLSRWVQVSSISDWTNIQRRSIPCSSVSESGLLRGYGSQLRRSASTYAGALWTYYLDMPSLSFEDSIIAMSCNFSIPTSCHADTSVELAIFSHDSSTPDDTYDSLGSYHLHTQSDTYIPMYYTFPTPISPAYHPSLGFRLRIYEKVVDTFTYYIWVKQIYIDTLRLI